MTRLVLLNVNSVDIFKISESYKFQHNILKMFLNDLCGNRDKGEGHSSSESPGHFSGLLSSLYHIPLGDFTSLLLSARI